MTLYLGLSITCISRFYNINIVLSLYFFLPSLNIILTQEGHRHQCRR